MHSRAASQHDRRWTLIRARKYDASKGTIDQRLLQPLPTKLIRIEFSLRNISYQSKLTSPITMSASRQAVEIDLNRISLTSLESRNTVRWGLTNVLLIAATRQDCYRRSTALFCWYTEIPKLTLGPTCCRRVRDLVHETLLHVPRSLPFF